MYKKTTVIYLIGRAGTGKYTIAKELAKTGYRIADNQLINNPIFELLGYDGFAKIPEFAWDAIGKIRNVILDFISIETCNNYVLTNELLEGDGDRNCYNQVKQAALKRDSLFVPIKLNISRQENARRIANHDRALRYKSLGMDENAICPLLNIEHPNLLELDVTNLSAMEAANHILCFIKRLEDGLVKDLRKIK
jgi:hypothetical protein